MKLFLLAIFFSIAHTHERESCHHYSYFTKGNAIGFTTSRPSFAGLTRRSNSNPTTTFMTTWVCWKLELYNRNQNNIGEVEDCIPKDDISTAPNDLLHVYTLNVKHKGTLVFSTIQSAFQDTQRTTATGTVLVYTGNSLPGESKLLSQLSTRAFSNQDGYCYVDGVQDHTEFIDTIPSTFLGMIHTKRMAFHCKTCPFSNSIPISIRQVNFAPVCGDGQCKPNLNEYCHTCTRDCCPICFSAPCNFATCGTDNLGEDCLCFSGLEGCFCAANAYCSDVVDCNSNADCASNELCTDTYNGCSRRVCLLVCPNIASNQRQGTLRNSIKPEGDVICKCAHCTEKCSGDCTPDTCCCFLEQ